MTIAGAFLAGLRQRVMYRQIHRDIDRALGAVRANARKSLAVTCYHGGSLSRVVPHDRPIRPTVFDHITVRANRGLERLRAWWDGGRG